MGQILRSTERILVIVNTKMSIVAVCDYSIDCLAYSDERLLVRVAGLFVPWTFRTIVGHFVPSLEKGFLSRRLEYLT